MMHMDKSLLAHLTDSERLLFHETGADELAALDEDAVVDLHRRIRRARNKFTGVYRRQAKEKVAKKGARGTAHGASTKNRARAEVFEVALARVSRRLEVLARESAEQLRAERLDAARSSRSTGPASGKGAQGSDKLGTSAGATAQARRHAKTPGGIKRDASTRAAGARKQAKRDAR